MNCDAVIVGYAVNSTSGGYTNKNVKYVDTVGIKYLYSHFYGTYCAEPVAFLQLAAQMRKCGITTYILDGLLEGYSRKEMIEKLNEINTDVYCFSLYESSKDDVTFLMRYIKQRNINAKIITGGPYVTLCYEEIMNEIDEIDYIVIGDGDVALPHLVYNICNSIDVRGIANVVYRDNNGNATIDCPPQSVDINSLEQISRDFHKIIIDKGFSFSISSSRGCGYANCSFCYLKRYQDIGNQPKYRYRDARLIVDEMHELIKKYDIKKLTFVDEDFFGDNIKGISRVIELLELIINEDIELDMYVNARVATIKYLIDNNLLDLCARAGIKYMFIGFESYNDEILKRYNKGITTKDIDIICDYLQKYNISINPGMITFDYDITIEQVKRNIDLLKRIDYYDAFMFTRTLMILPDEKTKIRDNKIHRGDFKHKDTELLYDILVTFRDRIYKLYADVDKNKITDIIRSRVINLHYEFFYCVYKKIMIKEYNHFQDDIEMYYNRIKKEIDITF